MTKHLEDIRKGLDIMHLTCDTIQKFDGCDKCPLKKKDCCLEETDALTLAETTTNKMWTDFFEHGDYVQTLEFCFDDESESMWGDNTEEERAEEDLFMEDYYKHLPRKEINVYGHNITIVV